MDNDGVKRLVRNVGEAVFAVLFLCMYLCVCVCEVCVYLWGWEGRGVYGCVRKGGGALYESLCTGVVCVCLSVCSYLLTFIIFAFHLIFSLFPQGNYQMSFANSAGWASNPLCVKRCLDLT